MVIETADEQRREEQRAQLAAWDRCAWCWNRPPAKPHRHRGRPYCDERCASGNPVVALDAPYGYGEQQSLFT